MNRFAIQSFISLCFICLSMPGFSQTIAEKLGYPADAKLLIIHADDVGMCHGVNVASLDALEKGIVTSGSIMVPCGWFLEVADYMKKHDDVDLGIHLTLTAEWKQYRWRPLTPFQKAKSLFDPQKYMFHSVEGVYGSATVEDVEAELRAQIEHTLDNGVKPTHMDSHMGTLYYNPDYLKIALKLSEEYDIPFMMFKPSDKLKEAVPGNMDWSFVDQMEERGVPLLDDLYQISGKKPDEYEEYYKDVIQNLQPGVSILIIHLANDSDEVKAITSSWERRVTDYTIFTSESMREFIKEQNVHLIGWSELLPLWNARKRLQ
jgi:predicted glycoside hydrolase/deacetylase ChbG (UPF0249 family)